MRMMISYRVRADRVDEHHRLLAEVFAELHATQPGGLRYDAHVLADGRSFVDVVEGPDLPAPLPRLSAFQRYRDGLDDRCDEPVVMTALDVVHSYRGE
jgi:hypothetical protein